MPQGDITAVWTDGSDTCMSVAVQEAPDRRVEYIGRVPTAELTGKTRQEQKQLLRQAVKAQRDAARTPPSPVTGITGEIDV